MHEKAQKIWIFIESQKSRRKVCFGKTGSKLKRAAKKAAAATGMA
jgi:hypothetical protein